MNLEHLTKEEKSEKRGRLLREIRGVCAVLGGLYIGLAVFTGYKLDSSLFTFSDAPVKNRGGVVGAYIYDIVVTAIGYSAFLLPFALLFYGLRNIFGRQGSKTRLIGAILFMLSVSLISELVTNTFLLNLERPGGMIGQQLAGLSESYLSQAGAYLIGIALLIISIIVMSPISLFQYAVEAWEERRAARPPVVKDGEADPETVMPELIINQTLPEQAYQEAGHARRKSRRERKVQEKPVVGSGPESPDGGYSLPPLEFLKEAEGFTGPSKEDLTSAAAGLEKKLADFKVEGRIKQAHPGPVVTMYEFEPAPGVKINRIVTLADDLALALRAPSIRVYPIAGKAALGIEVPNRLRATVSFREIIASEGFSGSRSLLTLALGKDIFGNPIVTDLARMPHLLVAGATGSGKSVSVNAMIMSLLYKATPEEVKMLMVDPKLLELSSYADIPHLISPVITNPKEASEALKKVVFEMERRYRLLAEKGSRNIETYNKQAGGSERLPYIVVFIDELADLMLTAPSDVETCIARLAQMARASGIHLIVATQRPSVDVITGLIKANFPARISFQVTSKIDSRTILDGQGAEQLLGMGDMLFMMPGAKIVRIHGAYVSESEVRAVTDFVKAQGVPEYTSFQSIVVPEDGAAEGDDEGERDDMYHKALEFAESVGEVSISSIQRRFKIGYNRAASIMDLFEQDGLVGPPKGAGKPRDFLGRR
jgi:S-DNA-T family DNA segregation ATPase FtsK/SpoIIIE